MRKVEERVKRERTLARDEVVRELEAKYATLREKIEAEGQRDHQAECERLAEKYRAALERQQRESEAAIERLKSANAY